MKQPLSMDEYMLSSEWRVVASKVRNAITSGVQVVYKWGTSGVQVDYKWVTSGLQVGYRWYSWRLHVTCKWLKSASTWGTSGLRVGTLMGYKMGIILA